MNGHRVIEFGFGQIANADFSRVAQVDRGAIGQVKSGGCPDGSNRLLGRHPL